MYIDNKGYMTLIIYKNGKRNYALKYEGKIIKKSINKDKLQKIADKLNKGGE